MTKHPVRTQSSDTSEQGEWSLKWVALGLMGLAGVLCWSLAASSYAHNVEGWRSGGLEASVERGEFDPGDRVSTRGAGAKVTRTALVAFIDFLANAVKQIPNVHRVLWHSVTTAWWVLILFLVLESLFGFFWWKSRSFEQQLANEERRRWQPNSKRERGPK